MLTEETIIRIFCLIDDSLKAMNHRDDMRARISDSEVLTTAVVSGLYFGGHTEHGRQFMQSAGYIPAMLSKSRLCRRLHRCQELIEQLTTQIGQLFKDLVCEREYILDSFPVPVCDNIRISRSRLLQGEQWRGWQASMRRYFYGVKVQLVITASGVPVDYVIMPGCRADVKALRQLCWALPPESRVYADAAYTDYQIEDLLAETQQVLLDPQRKSNSKRGDQPWTVFVKQHMRKKIETAISELKGLFLRRIHAVTAKGFQLKLSVFLLAFTLKKAFL